MNPYVLTAYGLILGTLAVYALRLRARRRKLRAQAGREEPPSLHGVPEETGPSARPSS